MYTPAAFAETRVAELHGFLRAHPFATLVTDDGDAPYASHIPLHLTVDDEHPHGVLVGHVARGNAHWKLAAIARPSLAIFSGAHAYVSPSWYPGKAAHHREVPTWNYSVVHAYGRLEAFDDPDALRQLLEHLTDAREAHRATRWRVSDAPDDYVRTQLRGIVGLRLPIARLEGKFKLGQNRPADDRLGATAGLDAEGDANAHAIAAAMRATLD
ncbi:MAG TPA: FMN-binding negative transcriptional regulator [Tahibacter sp.]|nr:FMN-binding negative transcriptional regulator [Tahibacter sp.]